MIETSRFLSSENRVEHHAELIEDLLRQSYGVALMSQVLSSSELSNHMTQDDARRAFIRGIRNGHFHFEDVGTDDPVISVINL